MFSSEFNLKLSFFFLTFAICLHLSASSNCKLEFKRSKLCKIYKYDERCFEGKAEFCEIISIKRNQDKCPFYVCNFQTKTETTTLQTTSLETTTTTLIPPKANLSRSENISEQVNDSSSYDNLPKVILSSTDPLISENLTAFDNFSDVILPQTIDPLKRKNISEQVNDSSTSDIFPKVNLLNNDTLKSENLTVNSSHDILRQTNFLLVDTLKSDNFSVQLKYENKNNFDFSLNNNSSFNDTLRSEKFPEQLKDIPLNISSKLKTLMHTGWF